MKYSRSTVEKVMKEVFGQEILPVTKLLNQNEEISELKLADKLKVEVNEARRSLYKLYQENLVSFKRKKDNEHGWYTYYWSFNYQMLYTLLDKTMNSRLNRLHTRLSAEKDTHYFSCCLRLDIASAMTYNFKCPECGSIMQPDDNTHKIIEIEENIKDIKKIIKTYS